MAIKDTILIDIEAELLFTNVEIIRKKEVAANINNNCNNIDFKRKTIVLVK